MYISDLGNPRYFDSSILATLVIVILLISVISIILVFLAILVILTPHLHCRITTDWLFLLWAPTSSYYHITLQLHNSL